MISASEATTALTSALKAFNLAAEDAINVVDKLTKVDQLAAVSAGGIATALQKSATSAKLAGMSMDELIGSVSVVGEVTQQSMDTVGHAMKSILARYGNVKAGVFTQMGLNDDGETTENINDIEKVLSKLGIKVRSSAKEMRSITDVLDDVNSKWSTFDTVTKNAIATAFGGTRMRENFLVLMENWNRVKELTEESANAAGTADEKYSAYMDSIEASTKKLQNAWEGFTQSIKGSGILKFFQDIATGAVNALNKFMPFIVPFMAAFNSNKITNFIGNSFSRTGDIFSNLFGGNRDGSIKLHRIQDVTVDEQGNVSLGNIQKRGNIITRAIDRAADTVGNAVNNGELLQTMKESVAVQKAQLAQQKGENAKNATTAVTYEQYQKALNRKVKGKKTLATIEAYENQQNIAGVGLIRGGGFWGLSRTGRVYTTNDGQRFQYDRKRDGYYYLDESGKRGNLKVSDRLSSQAASAYGQQVKQIVSSAAVTGIISAIALSQQRVIAGGTSLGARAAKAAGANIGDETTEADQSASVAKGIVGGLGTALSQLPMPWGLIGTGVSLLGNFAVDFWATMSKRDELETQKRVKEAKGIQAALNSLDESVQSISSDINTGKYLTSQQIAENQDWVTKFRQQLVDDKLSGTSLTQYIREFNEAGGSGYETIEDMLSALERGSVSQSEVNKIQNYLSYAIARAKAENYLKTREGDLRRAKLAQQYIYGDKTIGSYLTASRQSARANMFDILYRGDVGRTLISAQEKGYIKGLDVSNKFISKLKDHDDTSGLLPLAQQKYYEDREAEIMNIFRQIELAGETSEERVANIQGLVNELKKAGSIKGTSALGASAQFKAILKELSSMVSGYNKVKDIPTEYLKLIQSGAIYSYPMSSLTNIQRGELGKEGVIDYIAEWAEDKFLTDSKWSGILPALRDESGMISKEFKELLEKTLSTSDFYNDIVFPVYSIREMGQYQKELDEFVDKYGVSLEELRVMSNKGGESFKEFAESVGMTTTELRTLMNIGDKSRINEVAEALGLTSEQLNNYIDKVKGLESMSFSAFTLSSSELKEKFDLARELFNAAAQYVEGQNWSQDDQELLNKVRGDSFFNFLTWTDEGGITHTVEEASATFERLRDVLYNTGLTLEQFMTSFQDWAEIKTSNTYLEEYVNYLKQVDPALAKIVREYDNIEAVLQAIAGSEIDGEQIQKTLKAFFQQKEIAKYDESLQNSISASVKENERLINNLTAQKEALSDINSEREKELELIKARNALDEAKKEKKRVYRAGIGFVMESNEEAIAAAQEQLDKANVEKQQELIQAQIDQLELENEILNNLPTEKEALQLRNVMEALTTGIKDNTSRVAYLAEKYNNPNYTYSYEDFLKNDLDRLTKANENTDKNASGITSFQGGQTLINELGTEAVITPGGTLTALPSKTGIVPADITRNVWALGEVAPTLVAQLSSLNQKALTGNAGNTTYEEGQYIDNLTMNVYPTKDYDMDKLLSEARAKAKLTRHNN